MATTARTWTMAVLLFALVCVLLSGSATNRMLRPTDEDYKEVFPKKAQAFRLDEYTGSPKSLNLPIVPHVQEPLEVDTAAPTEPPKVITVAPTDAPTPPPPTTLSAIVEFSGDSLQTHVFDIVTRGQKDPLAIPVWCVPLFHDRDELEQQLLNIDYPVKRFEFVWNSDDRDVGELLGRLGKLPFGVSIRHAPENLGFSGALNHMITHSNATMGPLPAWWFLVNADAVFRPGVLDCFAKKVWGVHETHGMIYGPRQDHFAFAITQRAVNTVGLWDEVFFPGYMEDIDYHWRCCMAGLPQLITNCQFIHKGSVNMHKPNTGDYGNQLVRNSNGWEYGRWKWGRYHAGHIEDCAPPSGFKTPFNIPNAPLSLWVLDPEHRKCVMTGQGVYYTLDGGNRKSSTCWYDVRVLASKLPPGGIDTIPKHLFGRESMGPANP